MYASPVDLQRHLNRGCPEADTDSESSPPKRPRIEEESDEPAFEDLINEAYYDKFDDLYNEKVEKFIDDGMSDERAKQEASDMLRPKYRKALMKKYKEFLETLYYMKHSPLHYKVLGAIWDYEDAGKTLK